MKVTIDTGGLIYEFVEDEGWVGELSNWDRKLLEMTLKHVLATVTSPITRGATITMNTPPKGSLT